MAWIFEVKDPEGRVVRLDDQKWQMKILKQRPSLSKYLQQIQEAITNPQVIYAGNRPFSLLYCGKPFARGFHQGDEVRVAAYFDRAYRYGRVASIHITQQPYKGGPILWTAKP